MSRKVQPFLMFQGKAEERCASTLAVRRRSRGDRPYGPGESGAEGSVLKAAFFQPSPHDSSAWPKPHQVTGIGRCDRDKFDGDGRLEPSDGSRRGSGGRFDGRGD